MWELPVLKLLLGFAGSVIERLGGRWLQDRRDQQAKDHAREQLHAEITALKAQRDVPAVTSDAELLQLAADNAAVAPDLQ